MKKLIVYFVLLLSLYAMAMDPANGPHANGHHVTARRQIRGNRRHRYPRADQMGVAEAGPTCCQLLFVVATFGVGCCLKECLRVYYYNETKESE